MKLSLKKLSRIIKDTQASDRDAFIIVSGNTGEGKSTLATHLHLLVNRRFNKNMKEHFAFIKNKVKEKIETLPDSSSLAIDEGMNVLFNRDFMDKGQKEILKIFNMCRDKHLFVSICVPHFWSIDKHILSSGKIRMWIYIDKRGTGYIFTPDKNPFTEDPWHRKVNQKILRKWGEGTYPSKSPNFIGHVDYPDLPDDVKQEYLQIKEELKRDAEKYEGDLKKEINKVSEGEVKKIKALVFAEMKERKILPRGLMKQYAESSGEQYKTFVERVRQTRNNEVKCPEIQG